MLARFDEKGRRRGGDARVDDIDEGGKWLPPGRPTTGPTPVLAWIDERDRGPQSLPLEHVYAARGTDGGGFTANVRVDAGAPVPLAAHLDNKWSPAIAAAGGKVYVAWADFRRYNWDIFFARSDDGGRTFGRERAGRRLPRLRAGRRAPLARGRPRWAACMPPGPTCAHASRTRTSSTRAATTVGRPSRPTASSTTHAAASTRTATPPPTSGTRASRGAGDTLFAAWQDNRLGNNDVFFTTSSDGGATFARVGAGRRHGRRPQRAEPPAHGVGRGTLPRGVGGQPLRQRRRVRRAPALPPSRKEQEAQALDSAK